MKTRVTYPKSFLPVLMAATLLISGCTRKTEQTSDTTIGAPATDSVVITQVAAASMSVLDLLRLEHDVDVRGSAMGAFVTGIDSVETGGGCFWTYKVNDSTIPVACDIFHVEPGDTVVWRFNRGSR